VRIQFLLPGAHRVSRGAELTFEAIATEIAKRGTDEVTLVGSGPALPGRPYSYRGHGLIPRERFERFPRIPVFRNEYVYEECTWVAGELFRYRPSTADVTVTCSYPFVNWMLTRWPPFRRRPAHVFMTGNGDHPALTRRHEFGLFTCDGLICTNPVHFERNRDHWWSALIPNGIDPEVFRPGPPARERFGLPTDAPIVLMVSALVESKRVLEGMRAVASIPDAVLVVAGDGPLRHEFDALGAELMPGRHHRLTLPAEEMPDLYRSADVMVHPTLFESFGNVYLEAMAVGLPVVAHDSVVTRWILGDAARLVDTTDERTLADAVCSAIKDGPDEALAATTAVAERFAWSTVAGQYRDFLAEVVARHQGAA
jgi:glycosyltransferase involved in cell wall biosynthesis